MARVNPRLEFLPAMLLIISAIALPACSGAAGSDDAASAPSVAPDAEVESIRAATARFRDVNIALKEGYVRDPMNHCFIAPFEGYPKQLGAMGIHYFRPDLLGVTETTLPINGSGTHTDFTRPGILLYEPQEDGRLELVAVENLVFADAWHRREKARPSFRGNEFYRMIDNPATTDVNEAHMFMPHYELHMWLYRDNPHGMFAQFNPNVTCEHHPEATAP
jgi:hypothetical protein